ncbi:MAG: PQQ-dependent sugar dehydrogenase [Ferruginibacter sp.]
MKKNMFSWLKFLTFSYCIIPLSLAAQPVIAYQTLLTGLSNPVDVVNAGNSDIYIVQQGGIVKRWDGSTVTTFLNVSSVVTTASGEQGLLSLAFHPSYATNGYFFIWYTATNGNITLARYKRSTTDPTVGDPASGKIMLSVPKPGGFTNHNGGKLNFGPDGMLYIGTGDGGSSGDPNNLAQTGSSYMGKMLRLDVNAFSNVFPYYSIPADNPFLTTGDGILDEIYQTGLRNPWRWSFDRMTGDQWIADVGQGLYEEVNFTQAGNTAGLNFGWRCREGLHAYNMTGCSATYTDPFFEYTHNNSTGGYSITGGYVYRGTEFPTLAGYYLTSDYVTGNAWLLKTGQAATLQTGLPANIAGYGESFDGGILYILNRGSGALAKIIVPAVVPIYLQSFSGEKRTGFNLLKWVVPAGQDPAIYEVQYSYNNQDYLVAGTVTTGGPEFSYRHYIGSQANIYYRLKIIEPSGYRSYSSAIRLAGRVDVPKAWPTFITEKNVWIQFPAGMKEMIITDTYGRKIFSKTLPGLEGQMVVILPASLSKGIYILVFINREGNKWNQKIIIE